MAESFKNNSFQSHENHLIVIENIQLIYNQICFYRRILRPVNIILLHLVTK